MEMDEVRSPVTVLQFRKEEAKGGKKGNGGNNEREKNSEGILRIPLSREGGD